MSYIRDIATRLRMNSHLNDEWKYTLTGSIFGLHKSVIEVYVYLMSDASQPDIPAISSSLAKYVVKTGATFDDFITARIQHNISIPNCLPVLHWLYSKVETDVPLRQLYRAKMLEYYGYDTLYKLDEFIVQFVKCSNRATINSITKDVIERCICRYLNASNICPELVRFMTDMQTEVLEMDDCTQSIITQMETTSVAIRNACMSKRSIEDIVLGLLTYMTMYRVLIMTACEKQDIRRAIWIATRDYLPMINEAMAGYQKADRAVDIIMSRLSKVIGGERLMNDECMEPETKRL